MRQCCGDRGYRALAQAEQSGRTARRLCGAWSRASLAPATFSFSDYGRPVPEPPCSCGWSYWRLGGWIVAFPVRAEPRGGRDHAIQRPRFAGLGPLRTAR